jgi:beta-lactam-binding protein with PASTA domain
MRFMRRKAKTAYHFYILFAVALAVAVGSWGAWQVLTTHLYVPEVDVPVLVGKTSEQAALLIHRAGVSLESVERGFHSSVPEGQIFWQDPPPGKRVKRGRPLRILVSFGAQKVVVPDLIGRPLQMAQLTLESATLRVDSMTEEYDDVIKRQSVIGQIPPAGALLPVDSPIALIISRGPKPIEGASPTSPSAAVPQSVEAPVRP